MLWILVAASLALAAAQQYGPYVPDQLASSFSVNTIDNEPFIFNMAELPGAPILFMAINDSDPFTWYTATTNSSIDEWLINMPNNTQYLFFSYRAADSDAALLMFQLRGWYSSRMGELGFSQERISQIYSRLHFANQSVLTQDSFIQSVLKQWVSPSNVLQATSATADLNQTWTRFDGLYAWCAWPTAGQTASLVFVDNPCSSFPSSVNNNLALAFLNSHCTLDDIANNAQNANAGGVVFVAEPEQLTFQAGSLNSGGYGIIITMVTYDAGVVMREALLRNNSVTVTFQTNNIDAIYAGIDEAGLLVEVGWEKYPTMMVLTWEAQWLNFVSELHHNLTLPALIIPVMDRQDMQGQGASANVSIDIDIFNALKYYDSFELDMALTCPGTVDADCEIWDYIVNLYVCCYPDEFGNPGSQGLCGQELGRWITPFRRRIGRWLTPVNQLLPLLTSTNCSFTMVDPSWSAPWIVSLNLRFRNRQQNPALPSSILPLFQGGVFDSNYNNRTPINFTVPANAQYAQLEAVITGHGSDENGCGEFCVTSHHFIINGNPSVVTFSEAGSEFGCADKVPQGVEPNEHGTWFYGRDGWCDGQDVRPWVVNVTDYLVPGVNTVIYFGWYNGSTPNPTQSPGDIVMFSNLVFYDSPPHE